MDHWVSSLPSLASLCRRTQQKSGNSSQARVFCVLLVPGSFSHRQPSTWMNGLSLAKGWHTVSCGQVKLQLELPFHSSCPHSSTTSDREPLSKYGLSRWSSLQHLCYSFSNLESRCRALILKGHFLGHF